MSGQVVYGAIGAANVQAAGADDNPAAGRGEVNCWQGFLNFLQGPATFPQAVVPADDRQVNDANTIRFRVNPEACRCLAYVFFCIMCGFAILMTKFVTGPQLLQGPIEPGNTCPPFDGNKSHGFDVNTDSHLKDAFGFNNICMNWDYSPSRELTAMVYPLFEYTLVVYLVLHFFLVFVSYLRDRVTPRYWKFAKAAFLLQIVLCAWFRMIFVMIAYEDVRWHTTGFLGLQLALILLTAQNAIYVYRTKVIYRQFTGYYLWLAYLYAVCYAVISAFKLFLTCYVVFGWGLTSQKEVDGKSNGHLYPLWALHKGLGNIVVGHVIDIIWMIFNAFLPMIISGYRSTCEPGLIITIGLQPLSDEQDAAVNNGQSA